MRKPHAARLSYRPGYWETGLDPGLRGRERPLRAGEVTRPLTWAWQAVWRSSRARTACALEDPGPRASLPLRPPAPRTASRAAKATGSGPGARGEGASRIAAALVSGVGHGGSPAPPQASSLHRLEDLWWPLSAGWMPPPFLPARFRDSRGQAGH